MLREYPSRPILGVGGIVVRDNSVLLIQRGNNPGRGVWTIPGGRVNRGESLRTAVKREILEETGLVVSVVDAVKVLEIIVPDTNGAPWYHYVLVDYLVRPTGGALRAGSDAENAVFFPRTGLAKMDVPQMTREIITCAFEMIGHSQNS